MAKSSPIRLSSSSLFRDRSIRLKILFTFVLILAIILVQSYSSQSSLDQFTNTFDDGMDRIEVSYGSLIDKSAIDQSVQTLNTRIRNEQTYYLEYIANRGQNHNSLHNEIQSQISTEMNNIFSSINNLPEYINTSDGIDIVNQMGQINNQFNDHLEEIYSLISPTISYEVSNKLTLFSTVVQDKISNLLTWMYTGDETQLNLTKDELITNSGDQVLLDYTTEYRKLLLTVPARFSYYLSIDNNLQDLYSNFTENMAAFETLVNPDAGNAASINQNLLAPIMENMTYHAGIVHEIAINEIEILYLEIDEVYHHVGMVEIAMNDFANANSAMLAWTASVEEELNSEFEAAKADIKSEITDIKDQQQVLIYIFLIASVIVIFVVSILINSQIIKPIKTISNWSEQIAEGNLATTPSDRMMDRTDEIGKLHNNFFSMNLFLRNIIREVRESSELITVTSDDLSSNTMEINSTAEEVSAIAQSMAKGSTSQAEVITEIVQELQITSEIVDNVITQINHNLRIIHDLSEQTNILALNTAIEAANAGEFGRGFGVISESIRKMATQSKKTTSKVTKDSREILLQLRQTFKSVSEKIENVASVSEETAASAEEVAASAEELTAVIQEIAARSSALNDRSHIFEELVGRFRLSPTFKRNGKDKESSSDEDVVMSPKGFEGISETEPVIDDATKEAEILKQQEISDIVEDQISKAEILKEQEDTDSAEKQPDSTESDALKSLQGLDDEESSDPNSDDE